MPDEFGEGPNPHSGFGRVNVANSIAMVEPSDPFSGYGVGVIDEETEEPFIIQILVPSSSHSLTLKVTMVYADLPGAALSNDLNLIVVVGDKERHGNQGNQDFPIGAIGPFDRSNNVEQVMWPQITGESAKVIVKHYRLLSTRVPLAYAWRFLEE
ncbi:hypothetical protein RRF57_000581 [Xylaria bambusicola]|uniref:Uncharacterized protein n=1 Tax=Xylaria bambusicola TaxID=326684 RepID=A0AAN7U423_9PEZI